MLSGIRTGKKKKKPTWQEAELEAVPPFHRPTFGAGTVTSDNLSVADRLRQALATGSGELPVISHNSLLEQLEQRGRIESKVISAKSQEDNIVVQLPIGRTTTSAKKEEDMTIQELVANERRQNQDMSWDEQMTRNMARMDKNRKRKLTTNEDSDEEIERMKKWLPAATTAKEGTVKEGRGIEKAQQRDRHRLLHVKIQEDKVTSRCSWWLESSSFQKHRLLALGNHVSLVMAPPNASLIAGNHFYLVPLKHTPSFVSAEGDAWREILRFQTALQNLYARQGKSVIMLETVLEHSKGLWQTKLEVVPVPFGTLQDSPMYFSSSMKEQTEEWGTHTKLLKVSTEKPLQAVVPNGFPYFYVDWGRIATLPSASGYCQIIESQSFSHDFGLDTVAAMLDLDPIRLNRKKSYSHEEERQQIADFMKLWEKVDWTKELDSMG
jgi:Protein similar to CwfJ C-terminus 2/Protein similar to CwfJ C-terminus 1